MSAQGRNSPRGKKQKAAKATKAARTPKAKATARPAGTDKKDQGAAVAQAPFDFSDNRFTLVWGKFMQALGSNPDLVADLAKRYSESHADVLAHLSNGEAEGKADGARPDRRFSHPAWRTNPFYRYLKESYELNCVMIREAADKAGLEGAEKHALDFLVKQLVAATSPTNYLATNPEVAEATIESKGENLRRGMENYLGDVKAGKISLSDPDAFVVGENVATTPGKVVFQNNLIQLIEYAPTTRQVYSRPLVIVPPCINKYYILDLSEKNSFIRHLVAKGQRVFLVSWVNAGPTQAKAGWDDYVAAGVIEAIRVACDITGQKDANTLGYCIGGTLLACALSVMRQNGDDRAASMSLLTSFLDFSDTGDIGLFVDEAFVAAQEERFADGGLFPGGDLHHTFAYLRPDDLVWPYVVRNYMLGEKPQAFDILHWNSDSTNLPGRMYSWYLRHTYLDNDLKDGDVEVCGVKVDVGAINLPGMVVACERDHIVPWRAAYDSARLMGREVSFVLSSSGHVAGVVNPPASRKGHRFTAAKGGAAPLPVDPDKWLAKAARADGSWWDDFTTWLGRRGGKRVAAPKGAGDYRHRPVEDAPGSYVTAPLPESGG